MDSESSTGANPSQGRGVPWLVWLLALFIIGYPLSIGPLAAFYAGAPPKWFDWFYAPLGYLATNVPVVRAFYDLYLPLWGIH